MANVNNRKRHWQPREMQMVQEYLTKYYSRETWATRVRLGSPQPSRPAEEMTHEELAALTSWRRWADAIVYLPDRIILIEAAIRPEPGDVSKLQLYKMLFPHTPELERHANKPVEMILLYAIEDPATNYLARQQGIRTVEYKPPWLNEYLAILYPRERRGSKF